MGLQSGILVLRTLEIWSNRRNKNSESQRFGTSTFAEHLPSKCRFQNHVLELVSWFETDIIVLEGAMLLYTLALSRAYTLENALYEENLQIISIDIIPHIKTRKNINWI